MADEDGTDGVQFAPGLTDAERQEGLRIMREMEDWRGGEASPQFLDRMTDEAWTSMVVFMREREKQERLAASSAKQGSDE